MCLSITKEKEKARNDDGVGDWRFWGWRVKKKSFPTFSPLTTDRGNTCIRGAMENRD